MITTKIQNTEVNHKIYTQSLKPEDNTRGSSFLKIFTSKAQDYVNDKRPCEYFQMADKNGIIQYKKSTFVCNKDTNTLELGDCSNEENCLRIKLSKGGSLLVNRDNIDELISSISMFSAKDQGLIMQAIMQDKIATNAKNNAESEEVKEIQKMFSR